MIAYISLSYSKRKLLNKEIDSITVVLRRSGIKPFVFVDQYRFDPADEEQMMQQAMADIDNCGLFIAEVSQKAIGIGVETGYAKAKNKPIIYLRNIHAEHSTTVSGMSDFRIVYTNCTDLENQLAIILEKYLATDTAYL